MKKTLQILIALLLISSTSFAQEVKNVPEPLKQKQFVFPEFTTKTLTNGMKVFIIEDHEQPTVDLTLLIPGGMSVDPKPMVADIMTTLLTKGANGMTALQIAEKLDGIGASVSANAGADYITVNAGGLKKRLPIVLSTMADVVLKPEFYKDEFDKLIPQILTGLKNEKSNPSSLASALVKKALYGAEHPYAAKATESSVKEITLDDVKAYYRKWFVPNNASIAVIGDVKPDEITKALEEAFKTWKRVAVAPKVEVPAPKPMPQGVYFIERPASVQSTIMVSTLGIPYNHEEYETLQLASQVLGAGFAGRLFRTLRETHSYTYTPYGYLTSAKNINRFVAGADVRNSVTDSAISVTLEQLRLIGTEAPQENEMDLLKNYVVGQYLMGFENSDFIAGLIQGADFHGIPLRKVKGYPERIMAMSGSDMMRVAGQWINPQKAYIIVVGDPSVKEKIEKFGPVFVYNTDIVPATEAKMKKISMSASELINKYTIAIGGKEKLNSVKTLITSGEAVLDAQGQTLNGTFKLVEKAPNYQYKLIDFGMFKQEDWITPTAGFTKSMAGNMKLEGDELKKAVEEATMFRTAKMMELGYTGEVIGESNGEIIADFKAPNGKVIRMYFDAKTYLLNKTESSEDTPNGPVAVVSTLKDYVDVNGMKLPGSLEIDNSMFTIKLTNQYEVNPAVDDSIFNVPQE